MGWDPFTFTPELETIDHGACPGYLQHLLRVNKNIAIYTDEFVSARSDAWGLAL